jgi:PAS domain-containing protein
MVDVTEERAAAEKLSFEAGRAALAASVGATLSEGGSLDEMLQRSVKAVVKHLGAAFARIWTVGDGGTVLTLRASAGLYTHLDGDHSRVPIGMYKIGKIAEERRPHLTNDVPSDPRVSDKEWAANEGMVAFAGYPLLIEKRLLGVLAMFSRSPLPQESLEALHLVADRVALVIDQKRAQERLQEREAQLAEAQRIAGVGSWEWEMGQNQVTWSDELFRIYGLEPQSEPLTFDSYLAKVVPDDRDRVRAVIFHAVRDGGEFDFVERIARPDGEVRLLHSRGQTASGRSGETARLVGTCQDVTEPSSRRSPIGRWSWRANRRSGCTPSTRRNDPPCWPRSAGVLHPPWTTKRRSVMSPTWLCRTSRTGARSMCWVRTVSHTGL